MQHSLQDWTLPDWGLWIPLPPFIRKLAVETISKSLQLNKNEIREKSAVHSDGSPFGSLDKMSRPCNTVKQVTNRPVIREILANWTLMPTQYSWTLFMDSLKREVCTTDVEFGDDYNSDNDGAIGGKAMHDRSDAQGKSRPPCEKIHLYELKCLESRRKITPLLNWMQPMDTNLNTRTPLDVVESFLREVGLISQREVLQPGVAAN